MRDVPRGSIVPIPWLVAAGAQAKSKRIVLEKKLNIAEQTQFSHTGIAISLIAVVP
jgi:hypothetical protein